MIRVAIVGCGGISSQFIKGYLEFPTKCRITALSDLYPEKAQAQKTAFQLEDAHIYSSYQEMLQQEKPDIVNVCVPPYKHAEIAIQAMEAGANVLIEKPMAASLEECDQMLEAEKRTGKTLGVIAQNRFTTPIWNLKKIIDSGVIGRILFAQIDSLWWRGHSYYDLWWRGCWDKEGGGCTLNHAVHHIDMLGWMMGRPKKVTAVLSNLAHDNAEVEDISLAIMEYEEGALAQVTSSVIHYGEKQSLKFQGEHAAVSTPWEVHAFHSQENGFPKANPELEEKINQQYEALGSLEYEGHTAEIANFMQAVLEGKRPLIQGQDARLTIELISAIYKAGFTGIPVELPLKENDPFYTVKGMQSNIRKFHEKGKSIENFTDDKITL
ncbi:MAG: Gfo/Idh/MocA family oxidoreductase [Lachnoclostridium sp.]|jgi:predicted dehydrogenase|nr:Gfo/Idh/MocA family oxidoreductase [Lachnoclostridium sp.]